MKTFDIRFVFTTEVESIIDQSFYLISGTDGAALSLSSQ